MVRLRFVFDFCSGLRIQKSQPGVLKAIKGTYTFGYILDTITGVDLGELRSRNWHEPRRMTEAIETGANFN